MAELLREMIEEALRDREMLKRLAAASRSHADRI
jgi:hypothetical protein